MIRSRHPARLLSLVLLAARSDGEARQDSLPGRGVGVYFERGRRIGSTQFYVGGW